MESASIQNLLSLQVRLPLRQGEPRLLEYLPPSNLTLQQFLSILEDLSHLVFLELYHSMLVHVHHVPRHYRHPTHGDR